MEILHSVRVTAIAVDAPTKWVDNVLSHHEIRGVARSTHGVARSLNDAGLLMLALCRTLVVHLGIPIARAVELAASILDSTSGGRVEVSAALTIDVSLDEFRARLWSRVRDAHEAVAHVRRGRPSLQPPHTG